MLTELHIHIHNAGLFLKHKGVPANYFSENSQTFNVSYLERRWEEILHSHLYLKELDSKVLQIMVDFVNKDFDSLEM